MPKCVVTNNFEDYLLRVLIRAIFTSLYNIHHHVKISNYPLFSIVYA